MRLTNEAIEQITRSVINYYLNTKKRLPTNKEFNATYTDTCTDFLVFGHCNIPREEVEELSVEDKIEFLKDPLVRSIIDIKRERERELNNPKKLSRKERRRERHR